MAAGYALYGSATLVALSTGQGVDLFMLDPVGTQYGSIGTWDTMGLSVLIPVPWDNFLVNPNTCFWGQIARESILGSQHRHQKTVRIIVRVRAFERFYRVGVSTQSLSLRSILSKNALKLFDLWENNDLSIPVLPVSRQKRGFFGAAPSSRTF